MILESPPTITDPVFDGALSFGDSAVRRSADKARFDEVRASIGEPICWPSRALFPQLTTRPEGSQRSPSEALLVQFAFSLRVTGGITLDWARLAIGLCGAHEAAAAPVALDVCPLRVVQPRGVDLRVELTPTLRFSEVEAGFGHAGVGIRLGAPVPVVTAYGLQESDFGWDFRAARDRPLDGVMSTWAVVRAGESEDVEMTLDLNVDARSPRGLLPPLHLPLAVHRALRLAPS